MKTVNNPVRQDNSVISHLNESLSDFVLMQIRFILSPLERIHLGVDEKKGDIWRGGFGEALRSLACFYRWDPTDCMNCDKTQNCFYYVYFEIDKPHPYVFAPALDSKNIYNAGEEIALEMVLIGEAMNHAEKFIKTIEELGRIGIGAKRGRFRIKNVGIGNPVGLVEFLNADVQFREELVIEFLTPLKLKEEEKGIYYSYVPFEVLFKLLIKRIINLNNLYCNGKNFDKEKLEDEKQILLKEAKRVEVKSFTEWKDFKRFSSRQQRSMKIGGQLGIMKLRGDLNPFYPFLKIGEFIGVGQNTTSGFGRYKLLGEDYRLRDDDIKEKVEVIG